MKKTDWATIKQWYVQGEQGPEGLRYPTLEELAKRARRNDSSVRHKASVEKWAEQRKQFTAKVENLTAERKSTVMAGESVEFDSVCLDKARKIIARVDKGLESGEPVEKMATALEKAQKVGKLAFGENPDVDKDITIKVKYDDK
jgi:hypothetical protein